MDEAAKEGAMKHEPAVNADYAVANSEPTTAEPSSGVKSAADVTTVKSATAVSTPATMSATTAAGGKSVGA
jgi:hypothetical protein